MNLMLPFASKELPNGKKLFRRKHGKSINVLANAETTVDFIVHYEWVKINKVEILWAFEGLVVDFKVLDSAAGNYTGSPFYLLNQFGFDVPVAKDHFEDKSEYEADLYMGMVIRMIFKNTTANEKTLGVSIVFHEVKT